MVRIQWPTYNDTLLSFNETATTEIYTLTLHDALPICSDGSSSESAATATQPSSGSCHPGAFPAQTTGAGRTAGAARSEEHTSELQSRQYVACRLLLAKNIALMSSTPHLLIHSPFAAIR